MCSVCTCVRFAQSLGSRPSSLFLDSHKEWNLSLSSVWIFGSMFVLPWIKVGIRTKEVYVALVGGGWGVHCGFLFHA